MRADLPAHERPALLVTQDLRRNVAYRRGEEPLRVRRVRQQRCHLSSQRLVIPAGRCDERGALVRVAFERRVADVLDTLTVFGIGHGPSPSSSRSNQSFARRQSRLTVSGRHVEHFRRLLHAQATEESELDGSALSQIDFRQCL